MKTIALIVTLIAGLNVFAQADNAPYEKCTAGDMNLLKASVVRGNQAVNNLIEDEIIAKEVTSCIVSKPRFFHPAVCGTSITQIDTFIVTVEESVYTIVVDSSYRSCLRIRTIPMVKKFSYEPQQRPITFP